MLSSRNLGTLKELTSIIASKFEARIDFKLEKFLGMVVCERDAVSKSIKISSPTLIQQMLFRFSMEYCRPANTPLPAGLVLTAPTGPVDEGERNQMLNTPYLQVVGSLLHLSNTTRPDICYAASLLARFMHDPSQDYWKGAKNVLRYLSATKSMGLVYQSDTSYKDSPVFG